MTIYDGGAFTRELSYDGTRFTLSTEDRASVYPYLLTCPDARAESTVHYLLSEDPDMTQERYFSHLVSAISDPDFPDTKALFTRSGH